MLCIFHLLIYVDHPISSQPQIVEFDICTTYFIHFNFNFLKN